MILRPVQLLNYREDNVTGSFSNYWDKNNLCMSLLPWSLEAINRMETCSSFVTMGDTHVDDNEECGHRGMWLGPQ
jgi:hypothetical protein